MSGSSRDEAATTLVARLRPRPLEVACGLALGPDPQASALPAPTGRHPRASIEDAVRRALERPPCLVSFSGGRDSSAVLATAVAVAHREGLALPIPVTYRFAGAPGSDEAVWQEQVVTHLRLADWERLPITSELDSVGPVAQAVLQRHGLVWPFNAHFHAPLLARAVGGSLLTGIGGDELLGPQQWSAPRATLRGRRRPTPARIRAVALALSPRPVRRRKLPRHRKPGWPWLQPEASRAVDRQMDEWRAAAPLRWNRAVDRWWRSRYHTMLSASIAALATDAGTQVVHPFLDEAAVATAVRRFGARGPLDRSSAMRELFGDVLPEGVLTRSSKAHFDEAFFSDHSRAFVNEWRGAGVDASLVNPERLVEEWQADQPDPRSFLLIQAAWSGGR